MSKRLELDKKGFTLIELLVVVTSIAMQKRFLIIEYNK